MNNEILELLKDALDALKAENLDEGYTEASVMGRLDAAIKKMEE